MDAERECVQQKWRQIMTGEREGTGGGKGRNRRPLGVCSPNFSAVTYNNKKHLKNVGPIRHCEPPHAALPFTRCRYCRVAHRMRIDVHNNDDDDDNDNAWQRGPLWPNRMGPTRQLGQPQPGFCNRNLTVVDSLISQATNSTSTVCKKS